MSRTRSLLVTALAALALLLPASAAYAGTWRHTDPSGDVVVVEPEEGTPDPLPSVVDKGERRGDITRLSVVHGSDDLRISTSMRAFDNADNRLQVRIVTSHSSTFGLVHVRRGSQVTTTFTRSSRAQQCAGLRVSPTTAGVVVTIPRTCLARAYRVRVGVVARTFDRSYDRATRDDALLNAASGASPRLGPWVVGG